MYVSGYYSACVLVVVLLYISAGQALPWPASDNSLQEKDEGHAMTEAEQAITQWQNGWDGVLNVECPYGQAFYRVQSSHDNGREDRLWQWFCGVVTTGDVGHCFWTGEENWWDSPLFYMCPTNYFLTGVYSYHDNGREDRRWKFRCCHFPGHSPYNCALTWWVNDWDGWMDYTAPSGAFLNGAFSYHDNGKEDRLWKFEYCYQ